MLSGIVKVMLCKCLQVIPVHCHGDASVHVCHFLDTLVDTPKVTRASDIFTEIAQYCHRPVSALPLLFTLNNATV